MTASWSPEKNDSFVHAAQEMLDYLLDFGRALPNAIEIEGELIAAELCQTRYYGSAKQPTLSKQWDRMSDLIFMRLQALETTRNHLTCLALQKYGLDPVIDKNPRTIYISMDHGSRETDWHDVIAAVKRMAHGNTGWKHAQFHIEHNLNMPFVFDLLPATGDRQVGIDSNKRIEGDYNETVCIGADFSPSCYVPVSDQSRGNPGFGSIACFVQVKFKFDTKWRTCALTNHHVVRSAFNGFGLQRNGKAVILVYPPVGSDLWNADYYGYNSLCSKLKHAVAAFESPSRTKHNFTIAVLDEGTVYQQQLVSQKEKALKTAKFKQPAREALRGLKAHLADLEAEKLRQVAFFDQNKQILGKLIASSGFRRSVERRKMDWALIELDQSRPWSNTLLDLDAWKKNYPQVAAHPDNTYGIPMQPKDP
jgi:hypothetical protein